MITHNSEDVWTINNYAVYGSYTFKIMLCTRLNSGEHLSRVVHVYTGSIAVGFDGQFKQKMMKQSLNDKEYLKLYLDDWLLAMRTDEKAEVPTNLKLS